MAKEIQRGCSGQGVAAAAAAAAAGAGVELHNYYLKDCFDADDKHHPLHMCFC